MSRVVAVFDDVMLDVAPPQTVAAAETVRRLIRRPTTEIRFRRLSPAERAIWLELRALISPRTRYSLIATLVVCTLPPADLGRSICRERARG